MVSIVVVEEVAVDDVGELPLEASLGFLGGLEVTELAVVVVSSWAAVAGLDDGGGVEGGVQLAVPGPVEPVAADVPAGRFDWCGAGVAGEVALGPEAGDQAGMAR